MPLTYRVNEYNLRFGRRVLAGRSVISVVALALLGCETSSVESTSVTLPANAQAIRVYPGPSELPSSAVNIPYTDVTICVPGSEQCQTIHDVQIDTGSVGLRLLASEVHVTLPAVQNGSAGTLAECTVFADTSYVWGPVVSADIQLASEKALSVPIQLIEPAGFFGAPQSCGTSGAADNTVATLGARGVLGLGVFAEDCGYACTEAVSASVLPDIYFNCQTTGGTSSCTSTAVPLENQLENPAGRLKESGNGVVVSLPAVPESGAPSVTGTLYFGIGTQPDNTLGSASVYAVSGYGTLSTTFNGTTYTGIDGSILDTGTTILLMPLALPTCPQADKIFCPAATEHYVATNSGMNGVSGNVSFAIANAETLVATNHSAFNDVGGNATGIVWGLPFFFGRNVYIGIEGHDSPGGSGPFVAY